MLSVTSGDFGGVFEQPTNAATKSTGTKVTINLSDFIFLLKFDYHFC